MGKKGMGWVPDYPDVRDCTLSHEKVKGIQSNAPDSSSEGSDDRAQQLLKLVTMLEKTLPNLSISPILPELRELKEEFQRDADQKLQEADQKLHFISANFTEGFLSLGSEGKEVQDLQDKLRKLDYLNLESDRSGYYGRATEAAVKEFQTDQLLGNPNGIYTPFTRAELLAWVSIAGKLGQGTYEPGISGPGVIYIHALLGIADKIFNQKDPKKPLDLFSDFTREAILKLQPNSNESKGISENGDGTFDSQTLWKILVKYENEKLREKCPRTPVPKKKFAELKEEICKIIEERIDKKAIEIDPIVEVLIQLTPYIGKKNVGEEMTFELAIKQGYKWLLSMIQFTSSTESTERLAFLAQRLERGRGYVSSKIFRYPSYAPGVFSGSAVTYIQERLRIMGYYNGPTTGYFDEQLTQDAVKKFQSARLKQLKSQKSSPDGTFKQEDMDYLTGITEKFINLEPPLPDGLTDSLIADLGGLEEALKKFDENNIDEIISTIQQASKLFNWIEVIQSVVPPNALDASSEATLKKVIQGINDLSNTPEEQRDLAKQFLALLLRLTLHPIAKVVAQLISPIGKYSDPKEAFKDGLKRFRVIANFSQAQKIDRILNGLIVDVSGDIDGLTKEYEPLVKTLAILKAEFRQQALPDTSLNVFEQLQSLVVVSLQSVQPVGAKNTSQIEKFVQQIKNWIARQLFIDVERYVKLGSRTKQPSIKGVSDTIPKRDQTFIRVDPNCDRCSLQLPVTGKVHRALSQPTAPSQQTGECNTTYTTYLILPDAVDLSIWCSDVEDQGELDSCTAHAGVALLEYFEKKSFGNALDASSRFLYKVTRNLMHREGDTGASVRETMKAMVLFGVPPEEYCTYDEAKFDDDPSAFCYAFAQNYQTITYFRLDAAGMPAKGLLAQIKTILVGGFPCMFGFTVYDSIRDKTNPPGHIPYPTLDDKQEGGHAAIAVGYNDYKQIKNATNPGALLIKNSWGTDWGEGGYGWLPYDYVLNGLARDWWSLIKSEWVESNQFGLSSPDTWTTNLGKSGTTAND